MLSWIVLAASFLRCGAVLLCVCACELVHVLLFNHGSHSFIYSFKWNWFHSVIHVEEKPGEIFTSMNYKDGRHDMNKTVYDNAVAPFTQNVE